MRNQNLVIKSKINTKVKQINYVADQLEKAGLTSSEEYEQLSGFIQTYNTALGGKSKKRLTQKKPKNASAEILEKQLETLEGVRGAFNVAEIKKKYEDIDNVDDMKPIRHMLSKAELYEVHIDIETSYNSNNDPILSQEQFFSLYYEMFKNTDLPNEEIIKWIKKQYYGV